MIAVLTYDAAHRKTQDLLFRLLALGYREELVVVATPWVERKNWKPLFPHRPALALDMTLAQFCTNLDLTLLLTETEDLVAALHRVNPEFVLIAGAGILPAAVAEQFRVINSHPGYLPFVKGLDALKWAILEGQQIGVTAHFITPGVDEGQLIKQEITPLYFEDSFQSFAFRQYEQEIGLLADAVQLARQELQGVDLKDETYPPHRRMPHHMELKMKEAFELLRSKAPSFTA